MQPLNPEGEKKMKTNLVARATLAGIGLALFIAVALPAHATQCSLANVAAKCGYTTNGLFPIAARPILPAAAPSRNAFDGNGHVHRIQNPGLAARCLDQTPF